MEGPAGLLALLGAIPFSFPPAAADVPVWVCIEAADGGETCADSFAGRRFRRHMALTAAEASADGGLEEWFVPFAFQQRVTADAGGPTVQVGA